jgi:hypothetical protein
VSRQLVSGIGLVLVAWLAPLGLVWRQERDRVAVKSPMVTVVGCAAPTEAPHVWALSNAGEPVSASSAGITMAEKAALEQRSLGRAVYHLVGVAEFVDADAARRIGARDRLMPPSRMNTTGMLATGHRVAARGLYIEGKPPRINLTSVVDLGSACP